MSAGTNRGVQGLPRGATPESVVDFCNRLMLGRLNATQDLTLRASQTTTTITDSRIGPNSYIELMPQTANAQTAKATGYYISGRTKGSAVINHASSVNVDQTFTCLIIG